MTTKERCLEALKDNEFFQIAMKNNYMVCISHDYRPWIVIDGDTIFGNQYNVVDQYGNKKRIHDSELCCIFNDKRLENFYVCSQGQGTYAECKAKIDAERSHIRQCKNCDGNGKKCFYWQCTETISSDTATIYDEETDREITTKTTVRQYGCTYTQRDYRPTKSNCTYDIEDEPKLCTESWKDYFIQNPDGIPSQMPLRDFLVRHADEFGIVSRRWSTEPPSIENGFQHDKPFGSYVLEAKRYDDTFELSNARHRFVFRYDMKTHNFILGGERDLRYETTRIFTESKYDYLLQKSVLQPIACWDKFIKWWHSVIDAYLNEIN